MNIIDLFDKGGAIVWILAIYSAIALAILLERYIHYLRMGSVPAPVQSIIDSSCWDNRLEERITDSKGPEVALLKSMLLSIRNGIQDIAQVGERVRAQELQRMERGLRTLGILGNTAPLLGLLGTIIGLIKAFMVIEQAGGKVDAQALAGGIWEAMITTGVGLAVAIPVLILLHMLEGIVERRANSMSQCVSLVLEHHPGFRNREAPASRTHHWENLTDAV